MKKHFTLVLCCLALWTSSFAQVWQHEGTQKVVKECLDSIVTPSRAKQIFAYNNQGYNTMSTFYSWSSGKWIEESKNEYDYDSHGNPSMYAHCYWYWDNGNREGNKYEYVYDVNGKVTLMYSYEWNSGSWILDWKIEYEYDGNGNPILRLRYFLLDGKWILYGRYEFEYDANGNETLYILYYFFDEKMYGQINNEKKYDINGNLTQLVYYSWNDENWKLLGKYEYEYNENGNTTLFAKYDWNDEKWIKNYKKEYIYDVDENLIQFFRYFGDGGSWKEDEKIIYEYDLSSSNLLLPRILYVFNQAELFSIPSMNHKLLKFSTYSVWESVATCYWSSKDVNDISETPEKFGTVVAYPNPANDKFTIDLDGIATIKLYDMLGREAFTQNISGRTEINISHLPKGIYCIYVISEGKVIRNNKIVKQ